MEKIPVGTKVLYNGEEQTILAYNDKHFLIDNYEGGHDGNGYTWYDENGNEIPYVKGRNRLWLILPRLSKITILTKEEPDFIFGI